MNTRDLSHHICTHIKAAIYPAPISFSLMSYPSYPSCTLRWNGGPNFLKYIILLLIELAHYPAKIKYIPKAPKQASVYNDITFVLWPKIVALLLNDSTNDIHQLMPSLTPAWRRALTYQLNHKGPISVWKKYAPPPITSLAQCASNICSCFFVILHLLVTSFNA